MKTTGPHSYETDPKDKRLSRFELELEKNRIDYLRTMDAVKRMQYYFGLSSNNDKNCK